MTSFLEAKGAPGIVERTLIRPPSSQLGPIDPMLRKALIAASPVAGKYETLVDRDSAYERLKARAAAATAEAEAAEPPAAGDLRTTAIATPAATTRRRARAGPSPISPPAAADRPGSNPRSATR